MTLPIPVKDIIAYLPHRPPMVWIDEVTSFSEKAGECQVQLRENGLYVGPGGRLRQTSCLEFIAQAYGFISVCHHIYVLDPNSKPLSKAFLASVKNTVLPPKPVLESLRAGDQISISISGVRQMGPIVMFTGLMKKGATEICKAQMKVFKEYQK